MNKILTILNSFLKGYSTIGFKETTDLGHN